MVKKLTILLFPLLLYSQTNQDTIKTYLFREITIMANRGGGIPLNVPMSLNVIGSSDLALRKNFSLFDALTEIPGVFVQLRNGTDVRISVRGFGSRGFGDKSNSATIRGIKILVDGFPETEPDGRTSLDFADAIFSETIEIMKTNASTLFGNASGGVINFETFTEMSNSSISFKTFAGSFGLLHYGAKVKFVGEKTAASVFAGHYSFDGWRENSSVRKKLIYSILKFSPDEKSSAKVVIGAVSNLFYIPGPLSHSEFLSSPQKANQIYLTRKERRYNRIGRFGFELTRSLNQANSFYLNTYFSPKVLQRSERNTFRDFNRYHIGGGLVYEWKGLGLRFSPRAFVGFDFSYQDGSILFYTLVNGERGDSLRTNKREGAGTYGAFFQVQFQPFEPFEVIIGGRYDGQNYISEVYPAGVKVKTRRDELKMNHFTPRIALLYKVGNTNSLYVNFSGGIEAPAFNEVDPPPFVKDKELNPFLKPMFSSTLEAGFKGVASLNLRFLKSLLYALSAYRISVNNEIVPYNGGAWFFSAGRSKREGIEASIQADISQQFNIRTSLTFMNAKFVEYVNELGNFADKFVPGIPKYWGSFTASYKASFLKAEVNGIYISEYFADDLNSQRISPYFLMNVSLGFDIKVGSVKISLLAGCENLFNRNYIASVFINSYSDSYIEPGLPRNFYAGASLEF